MKTCIKCHHKQESAIIKVLGMAEMVCIARCCYCKRRAVALVREEQALNLYWNYTAGFKPI